MAAGSSISGGNGGDEPAAGVVKVWSTDRSSQQLFGILSCCRQFSGPAGHETDRSQAEQQERQ